MLDRPSADHRFRGAFRLANFLVVVLLVALLIGGIIFVLAWQLLEQTRQKEDAQRYAAAAELRAQAAALALRNFVEDNPDRFHAAALAALRARYGEALTTLKRAPRSAAELRPSSAEQGEPALELNRYDVAWGLDPSQLDEEAQGRTLLAWEKKPDADGRRWAAFADGATIRHLTAEEFAKLRGGPAKTP